MKHTRICPKCGGNNILRVDGQCGPYGTGNNIPTGATIFNVVMVNRYLCADCGYSEEWIDKADIEKVKKYKKTHEL